MLPAWGALHRQLHQALLLHSVTLYWQIKGIIGTLPVSKFATAGLLLRYHMLPILAASIPSKLIAAAECIKQCRRATLFIPSASYERQGRQCACAMICQGVQFACTSMMGMHMPWVHEV